MFRPLTCLTILLLAACTPGGTRGDDSPVVVSAIGSGVRPADPDAGTLDPARRIWLSATAQGLVRLDGAGQIEAGLAERWIVIDQGLSYIFRLREGAEWPDGTPVTAGEVVRILRRAIAPDSRNALGPFLAVIDDIVEMTPQIVEVRLRHPRPDLLKLFAQPELAIDRAPGFEGSGPFRASEMRGAWRLRPALDPNADRDAPSPSPAETLVFHAEPAARAIARFRAGASDLVLGGSLADWPIVGAAGIAGGNIRIDPAIGLFGLAIVAREGFLTDPANRKALAMAIDRPAITAAFHPNWAPIETLLPAQLDSSAAPAEPGWAPLSPEDRLATARGAVAAWKRNAGPVTLRVALPGGPGITLLWAGIARSLLAIGILPERVGMDDADADLRLVDAVAPYDSARWFVATACQRCSEATTALVEAGRDAPDLDTRAQRIADADAAIADESAFIPIAQPFRWSIVALRLQAWQGNARAWHPLNHLRNETR